MALRSYRRKTVKPQGTPEELLLFKQFSDVITATGVEIRVEKGNFRDGLCTVEGEQEILFLNKKHPLESRIAALAAEIRRRQLSETLSEALQQALETYS